MLLHASHLTTPGQHDELKKAGSHLSSRTLKEPRPRRPEQYLSNWREIPRQVTAEPSRLAYEAVGQANKDRRPPT